MSGEAADVALVVAIASNGVIGRDGKLPWRLPSELKAFRSLTMNKPLIMGRKTFVSLKKPLDGRDNIVLTRDLSFAAKGTIICPDITQALAIARQRAVDRGAHEIIVIGGAEVFAALLPFAKRAYVTRVHADIPGDTVFELPPNEGWRVQGAQGPYRGPGDEFDWSLETYHRQATVRPTSRAQLE